MPLWGLLIHNKCIQGSGKGLRVPAALVSMHMQGFAGLSPAMAEPAVTRPFWQMERAGHLVPQFPQLTSSNSKSAQYQDGQ